MLLGLETSCDETAAAVLGPDGTLRSSVVGTQAAVHARYGGVVPEIAGREHVAALIPVVREALDQASIAESDLTGIAVTVGPGLIGSLLVGLSFAQGMAFRLNVPLAGVHHIEAHLLAVLLEREVAFPFLGLVVSGGHTHLYRVDRPGRYSLLGRTRDDAAGEAFDKAAVCLGLSYPGGVSIEKASRTGDPQRYGLPRGLQRDGSFDFSFSGLKTAVRLQAQQFGTPTERQVADLAASVQEAIVDSLVTKTLAAARHHGLETIVVAGGVAANKRLRSAFETRGGDIQAVFPDFSLCTDNAAMVACAGMHRMRVETPSLLSMRPRPAWPLEEVAWPSSPFSSESELVHE